MKDPSRTNQEILEENALLKQKIQELERYESGRKQAEEDLRKSEERYRTILEDMDEGYFEIDLAGNFTFVNDAECRDLGYSREEMIGMNYRQYNDEATANKSYELYSNIYKTGKPIKRVLGQYISKDGMRHFNEVSASLIRDAKGKPIGFRGISQDVTDRKRTEEALQRAHDELEQRVAERTEELIRVNEKLQADIIKRKRVEEALRESEEKYRNLFENAAEAIFVIQDGKLVFLNPMAVMMTGYSGEELMTEPFAEFIHPDDRDMVIDRHVRRLKGEELPHVYSFRITHRDGSTRWVELNAVLINWKGKAATLNFLSNITERKRMEEELLKADKLESVGILAGGIAHDFNNILTSISGNISMAKMQVKPGHKIFDLLSAAEIASMRAHGLTMQLLTFAKGGLPVKETAFLKKLIKESTLFVLHGSKSVCEFQMAEDLWPVEADTGQISQVISNIVINANQAMPEGGTIRITAENLMPEKIHEIPVKQGRCVHISIKDQGVGIGEQHLSKIFDPYFTTKQAGSGLGLATAYSIIKKHNGHISVNSLPGAGTAFHIYLPASGKEIPVKEEAVLLTGRGKILMMDDDEFLKELAKEMLDMLGYESAFARDGAEAIEMYKKARESEKPYDAVILDLTIPGGMGGEEVIKILLNMYPEVKAIVFSGYAEGEVMSNYRKYGFKGMMPKPFDLQALGKVLNDVLKNGKSVKET